METVPSRSTSHSATASMTGYLYQARYALLRGLQEGRRNPGHELSMERLDDVAFEENGKPIELIQTKHHVRHGDLSDASVDLWKTIGIWIKRIKEDPTSGIRIRLVFLTTQTAIHGSALSMLRQADHGRDQSEAATRLVAVATKSKNQATEAARNAFLTLTDKQRTSLISNIWVFDGAPNIVDVRKEIESELCYSAPHDRVSHFTDHLEGWWFKRVVIALSACQSSVIPLAHIQAKIADIRNDYKVRNLPLDEEIDAMPEVSELPTENRPFIHQMTLVRVSQNEVLTTIHDYYRAYAQRSRWARQSLLLDDESERYDRALRDAWSRSFLRHTGHLVEDSDDHTMEVQGRKVFHWARQHQFPLRNRQEMWLSSGSFQILADDVRIGWHPHYECLLAAWKENT